MRRRVALGAIAAATLAASRVNAQGARPLTIIVPYAPGGGGDSVARVVAKSLGESLGRTVIVDNRPGANGVLAVQTLVRADADGSVLMLTDSSVLSVNPRVYRSTKYDPKRDLEHVGLVARGPLFLAVHPKTGVSKFSEFLTAVKAAPGRYNYGTPSAGSTHHLCMEYLKSVLGLNIQHVPFRGASPAVSALVSGEIEITFAALPSIQGFVQSSRVRLIAVNSADRYTRMPEIPAISETIPDFDFASNVGLVCARGVPKGVVDSLSTAIVKAVKSTSVSEALAALGVEPIGLGSAEYARAFHLEDARIEKAIQVTQLHLD